MNSKNSKEEQQDLDDKYTSLFGTITNNGNSSLKKKGKLKAAKTEVIPVAMKEIQIFSFQDHLV